MQCFISAYAKPMINVLVRRDKKISVFILLLNEFSAMRIAHESCYLYIDLGEKKAIIFLF